MDTVFSLQLRPADRPAEDERWRNAARAGEPWALEQLYAEQQASVYSLCRRLGARAEDAEDLTQAVFVRAFRELPRFRGESTVKTWLYRIAVNEALGFLRRRRGTVELPEDLAELPDAGSPAEQVVERVAVQAALARIRPDHRAVLVLRFWEGLSYGELAAVLRISLPAAKMRLLRARLEFRQRYEETP